MLLHVTSPSRIGRASDPAPHRLIHCVARWESSGGMHNDDTMQHSKYNQRILTSLVQEEAGGWAGAQGLAPHTQGTQIQCLPFPSFFSLLKKTFCTLDKAGPKNREERGEWPGGGAAGPGQGHHQGGGQEGATSTFKVI